jgi:hypothetical protein
VTDWPAEWRPVNPVEAQEYIDAHQDGSGDPELIEECKALLGPPRRVIRRGDNPGSTKPSPFPNLPEDLTEEQGAD